ncbi:MAG: hypothetical protein AB7H88_14355 [Vicinamibacterales bacterium]
MPRTSARLAGERGIALVTVMLLLLLTTSVLTGFLVVVSTDVKLRGVDRSRTQAFYAAHAGLEKLTADLGNLFSVDFSPELADIETIEGAPPSLTNVSFDSADGLGYKIEFPANADGDPTAVAGTVKSGPYADFKALITEYTLTATARTVDGSESRLRRTMQTVSIPVFQFGIFSETDLSFFAGPNFNFGGRVHTNGNLFLASGSTQTLSDRVTAVGEVIRTNLSNGWATSSGYTGNVQPITAPGSYRNLATSEGSLTGTLGSGENEPTWTNISIGTYNGYLRNGRTGARQLDLPLITIGGSPVDLIRRPVAGEDALVTGQRMFSQSSIRILLSDTATAITGLPGVSADAPLPIGRLADTPITGYTVDASHPPLAVSPGNAADSNVLSPTNTPLHDGYLKVEYRNGADAWVDVTLEWLNLGITRRNIDVSGCAEPNPDAILRLQRVKASPSTAPGDTCGLDSTVETDYWPLVLYDAREGWPRDNHSTSATDLRLAGVMHYFDLDVNNLRRWLAGEIGTSGANVVNEDGFVVYFSDRRLNQDAGGNETGELGFEDVVNPGDANGAPNGLLETGEDLNSDGTLETYGGVPLPPAGATAPLGSTATLQTSVTMEQARRNKAIFFRRALKISNGTLGNLPADGLTIVSENPVYVQGDYNANSSGFGDPHAPAAIMADAVTLLSNTWNQARTVGGVTYQHGDTRSLVFPYSPGSRKAASTTWYRFATIAGKGRAFPHISGNYQDYGTDGGVHNFLRMLEDWDVTLNYRGSIASFYYNRQAVSPYKCCTTVYGPPTRGYNFDTDFLDPLLLPPKTPMFRDVNTTGFQQVTRWQ